MAAITIKDIPAELHDALRERAETNRRSVDAEVIAILEQSLPRRGPSVENILDRARWVRSQMNGDVSEDDIKEWKKHRI